MSGHHRLLRRPWILLIAVTILIAGHGMVLYYISSHTTLSASVVLSVIVLVVIKHAGLIAPLFALLRRRSRH